jgi:hypothetical protein
MDAEINDDNEEDEETQNFNLLRAIARSEGLNSKDNRIKGYLPLFKHPLPVSDSRHEHERILKRVLSCKLEYQGIAAITLGDAWSLEEVYMRGGKPTLKEKNGSPPIHMAVQMNSIDCILVLINIGVDLSSTNSMGFTPLYVAHSAGLTQIVQLLRENKALMFVEAAKEAPRSTVLDVVPESRSGPHNQQSNNMNNYLKMPNKASLF